MRTSDLEALFNKAPTSPVTKQTVTLAYGKANFSSTLATYACFKVQPPFLRNTAITSGIRMGVPQNYPMGRYPDINGVVLEHQVGHDNGTVIMLQVSWKRNGAPIRDGVIFVRLRHGAPMYRIMGFVPTDRENIHGDRVTLFCGMGDIMPADELALLNIQPNRSYTERFMALEEVRECFTIDLVQAESISRPQLSAISTPNGVELREIASEPVRRLKFRGRTPAA